MAGMLTVGAVFAENIHFSYLWHMEQPVYWPIRQSSGADRYERAWQSILQTDAGRPNPQDNLRSIFQNSDRVAAYQYRARDAVNLIRSRPEAGVQVSFSGGLVEDLQSLGAVAQLGYVPAFYQWYREARDWRTADNLHTRVDIVQFSFHHALLPLCDDNTVRMQLRLYREVYPDAWGTNTPQSRGFFPSEMAFSERLIPILEQEGIDWAIVSNEHISRSCTNFPLVLGSGGVNCDPPNRADQLNPAQGNWYRLTISRGCGPVNAAPYAYTPHYARYVNPDNGQEHRVIVVPADQSIGWLDGSAPLPQTPFDQLSAWNDSNRPMLVLMAHDGDNFWGGGFSYYMEATPQFVNNAASAGYIPATVESYLAAHPVPANDVVHIEDGAWVNADGDFGSPMFINWNWPLLDSSGQPDPVNGWHVDARNWAVITAAQNRVDTATQIAVGTLDGLNLRRILYPDATTTLAERAWHYFGGALNSGFMYYGTNLDHEVKQTVACNQAVGYADQVIGGGSADATPPTVWIPQRWPYNPGSANFGPAYGYQQIINNGDFWIWTFAYDVSGLSSVTLKYRTDADDLIDDANRTYAGGAGAGNWQTLAMAGRPFPAGNVYNDGGINFFVLPTYIANHYSAQLVGLREVFVDYYVEATDLRGFVKRSPIQHVYVGDGQGSGGPTNRVVFTPTPGQAGQPLTIEYNATNGPLGGATAVFAHIGYDQWQVVLPDAPMTFNATTEKWILTITLPGEIQQLDVVFTNGVGVWDNNNGLDWHLPVTGSQQQWAMDGVLEPTAELIAENGNFRLYAEVRGDRLYVAANDSGEGNDHFIFVASPPGATRTAPWAKSGLVANWAAFVADENNNDFEGWFDVAAGGFAQAATGANGGVLEGVIDLDAEFGGVMPDSVWIAFAPYQSQDAGTLIAANQAPPSVNGNFHVDATEYVEFDLTPPFPVGDMNCDGFVTVGDIGGFVLALTDPAAYAAQYPGCDINLADTNNDGFVTVGDIGAFVALLTGN